MPNTFKWMDRPKFLKHYELKLDKEFEIDGRAARWHPDFGGPKVWGEEMEALPVDHCDPSHSNVPAQAIALTADKQVLAIASNAVIRIYHKRCRQHRAELRGHAHNVWRLHFASDINGGYILLSYSSFIGNDNGTIIQWCLDCNGRLRYSSRIMPFATRSLTDKAMSAIEGDLRTHHGMTDGEIGNVTKRIESTLGEANRQHRLDRLPHVDGLLPGFGSVSISHNGKMFIYLTHNKTTQQGTRPAEDLPQAVVASTTDLKEIFRLAGHQDSIMWASWSPDDNVIALASWDRHFSIWDARTGITKHLIGPTTGQNWTGAFSPDSKHVLLSGGNPARVAVYEVDTGKEVAVMETNKSWIRELAWRPTSNEVAVVLGQSVILWTPFEHIRQEVFKLQSDGSLLERYCLLGQPRWIDNGNKLVLRVMDSTIFIWDLPTNQKWRFQRPFGTPEDKPDGDIFWDPETQAVLSLDGDGVMRGWCLHGIIWDHDLPNVL